MKIVVLNGSPKRNEMRVIMHYIFYIKKCSFNEEREQLGMVYA